MRRIALEEHFASPLYRQQLPDPPGRAIVHADRSAQLGHEVEAHLVDLAERRVAAMDDAGIDVQVLSLTSPGCEALEAGRAIGVARDANDRMREAIDAYPSRFAAFAALPMGDPRAAVVELDRAVGELGFKGALLNGHVRGEFLDQSKYWAIFERAESLGVPIYLHPTRPPKSVLETYFAGYPELLGASWGFAVDTSIHFLRLVFSGVFDVFPKLSVILGHLGEGLPFGMHRLNDYTCLAAKRRGLKKAPEQYLRENLFVTTSGNFFVPAFMCTYLALGADRILFSVDWPYESNVTAARFLDGLPISLADRHKIAHLNAEQLLRI